MSAAPHSGALNDTAPAKLNLTLRVLGRRADGYHELESLVVFADIADRLSLTPGGPAQLDVTGPFAGQCGCAADNLVLKAVAALGLPSGSFSLEKHLPVAAGLGGGSADAAAALRLVARANKLPNADARILAAAQTAGADVAVCIDSRARIMRGIGERLSLPLALPKLHAVLVNPGVPLPTAQVFERFAPKAAASAEIDDVPLDRAGLMKWLPGHGNDLTRPAISLVPAIGDILRQLAGSPGCRMARMSGSGATCFGIFETAEETAAVAKRLSHAHKEWWISAATLG